MSKRQFAERLNGSRVSVRQRRISEGKGKADIYDLIISVGKGRKHAEMLRSKVEAACREIFAPSKGDAAEGTQA